MKTNLIIKLREGDDSCFKEIYELYHFKVYLFVNSYTDQPADTEDIVQNVFIHLWKYRKKIDAQVELDAVLFKSSRQEISRWYKKQNNFPSLEEKLREDIDIIPEWEEDISIKLRKIKILLNQIPEKRRKIFTLHKFEERSYKEIAVEMEMTPSAVANQISKTIQYLKENLVEDHCLFWFAFIFYFS
ncbi:RNA polymerase subunit sigma-24 [Flavobacterium psychrophilum]|nr:RNA polymerase subunit sigma-24 [Flavobacterium psychrophilum]AOE54280.1 RNA polymerase subunit sigma-24 [Flavobacterium psychrophilum]